MLLRNQMIKAGPRVSVWGSSGVSATTRTLTLPSEWVSERGKADTSALFFITATQHVIRAASADIQLRHPHCTTGLKWVCEWVREWGGVSWWREKFDLQVSRWTQEWDYTVCVTALTIAPTKAKYLPTHRNITTVPYSQAKPRPRDLPKRTNWQFIAPD
jgi:hypothetical protein